jgi:signal transduction histidine kinase
MTSTVDILLVDDERRNLDALEAILASPGYRLVRALDADAALRLLLEHQVAAIVLDIKMPGVSGFELAQIIKNTRRFRETPIVFLTAHMMDDQDIIAGYGAGGVDYLTKPVNPQILRQKIAVFAELFRKTRELADLNQKLEERVKERTADLQKSEEALIAAAAQKDEFLAVLAHELRNPLAPLRTGVDLLLRHQSSTPSVSRTLTAMNRQLDHMVRLIDDLLDISRISRGLLELKREAVDVEAMVRSAIEGASGFFERRGHQLAIELSSGIRAEADPTRLTQIVTNILHNAAKFTPDGGKIEIELRRDAGYAVLRVVDSGIGIAPSQIDRVFDMFARIERPGVIAEPGLGIGLALARRLAELHDGALIAESGGEGLGTTFTLSLPALSTAQEGASADDERVHPRSAPRALKILVIEDNDDVADTLASWLEELGHQVWVARNGTQGVELVQQAKPNLVLCDLGLPEMDGIEVCRTVRALPIEQPLMIALTGWGREDDRARTKAAGFNQHLVKPVAPGVLEGVLRCASEERANAESSPPLISR